MYRMPLGHFGGFLQHLGQRGVRVDRGFNFFHRRFERHGEPKLGDEFGGF